MFDFFSYLVLPQIFYQQFMHHCGFTEKIIFFLKILSKNKYVST